MCTGNNNVLGTKNNRMSNSLVVFPNPNVGEFGISFNAHSSANENVNVIIYDISGRCVYENSFLNN